MQHLKLSELKTPAPRRERRQNLMLVPGPARSADPLATAARARVRHALVRALQEFLDRAGFTELERAADPAVAALLGRSYWATRADLLQGLAVGADGATLLDLLERGLLAGLHGALNRGYADLQALGADLDRLKYVRLPVERVRHEVAAARWAGDVRHWTAPSTPADLDGAALAEAGAPVLLVKYTPDALEDEDAPAPRLLEARLLLPGVGLVATAADGGMLSLDVAALTRFLCAAEVAVLARPALAR
ncbi:MAG TPA: hypothetical protein VF276_17050 [Chloroflexia bacterium]